MPDISDIVQTSITATSATPSVSGFGKPLVMAQKVPAGFTNRYREYSSTTGMISDGFAANDPAVLAVGAAFAQNPRPPLVGVGRRANKTSQALQLTLSSAVSGDVYSVTIITEGGVSTTVTRTSTGMPATDATALAASIAGVSGFAGTAAVGAVITIVVAAGVGHLARLKDWTVNGSRASTFTLFDNSADPGVAADLAAVIAENNTWYGLTLDSASKAEIVAAAAWAETNKKLFVPQSSDSGVVDSGVSTDIASAVQSGTYNYTAVIYNGNDTQAYAGLRWQAFRFASSPTPGNDTWCYNTLAGLTVDNLTETEFSTLGNKNATGYVTIASVNYTAAGGVSTTKSGGKCGSGQFIDARRGLDWSNADIQVSLFAAIAPGTGRKVPMTDKGGATLLGELSAALQRGEAAGVYVDGSSLVNVPAVSTLSSTDRGNRAFTGITWTAQQAGAVHLAIVSGTVTT